MNSHDRFERQWVAMSVLPVSDAADRVTKDLDGRLWHMFVVVDRIGFPKVLQHQPLATPVSTSTLSRIAARRINRLKIVFGLAVPPAKIGSSGLCRQRFQFVPLSRFG